MGLQLNEIERFNLMKQLVNKPKIFQQYDTTVKVPREELEDLIDVAIQAPSSWDEQHWKFLVFDDKDIKEQYLAPIVSSQDYIRDAPAVVALLGDSEAYEQMKQLSIRTDRILGESKGKQLAFNNKGQQGLSGLVTPPLAAIQFMMGATAKGYDTYPILHFNPKQLAETFNVPDQFVPVMLIAIGKRKESSVV